MKYEPNPKHKQPWQRGQKGSLCPTGIDGEALLRDSVLVGKRRFATAEGMPFSGEEHRSGQWHGWPVGWQEVPEVLRQSWLAEQRISRRDVRRYWEGP